ncbi:hypothetical protein L798_05826 [Zootermopsis nevadensis]|uniref:Uncharacterized protein n=1 Tax=Zootermopsis nevadensis TaxID=136037 RepID=A0A067QPJ2_ZOONE|nr:hypothetical protein L798_05826 [Zootermopsis nevadensis]
MQSCLEIFDSPRRDCVNVLPQGSPQDKNPSASDPVTEEAMKSALHVQSTFLDVSSSTTAGRLAHSALELCPTARGTSSNSFKKITIFFSSQPVRKETGAHECLRRYQPKR